MKKITFKSILYCWRLVFKSGKILTLLHIFLGFLISIIPLLEVYYFNMIIDSLVSYIQRDSMKFIFSFIFIIILGNLLNACNNVIGYTLNKKTENQFNNLILNKMKNISYETIDSSKGRDICDYANNCGGIICNEIPFAAFTIVQNIYTFTVAFVVILKFNLAFSLLFISLTIPSIIFDYFYNKKTDELDKKTFSDVRKVRYYKWMLLDNWPSKDVRMYDLTNPITKRYDEERKTYFKNRMSLYNQRLLYGIIFELIKRSGEISFIIFVIIQAIKGNITIGEVVLYTGYAVLVAESFEVMVTKFVGFVKFDSEVVMPTFFKFIELPNDTIRGNKEVTVFENLEFKNVYFKYPETEKYILSGVTFEIKKGEKVSLVGINGAGKSTIVKLILGLYSINAGEILINGISIYDYSPNSLRKLFSTMFQENIIYPFSLRDNVSLSRYDENINDEEIICALEQSGIYAEIKERLKNGLDSNLTRKFDDEGIELSKGQWQKLALARVYFKDSQFLILDEPSSALDARAEDYIFKNIESLNTKTRLMISHRISNAVRADKVIVLNNGVIEEFGTHNELIALNGLYAKFYNLQKRRYTMEGKNDN